MIQTIVLSQCKDCDLTFTRAEILKRLGHSVVTASTVDELSQLLLAGRFDLAVLCHTLSEKERRKAAQIIHAQSPFTSVLVLAVTDNAPSPYADLTAGIGPYALVGAVSELLHKPKKVDNAHPHSTNS
jgi:CheY-like chemotaxis protein